MHQQVSVQVDNFLPHFAFRLGCIYLLTGWHNLLDIYLSNINIITSLFFLFSNILLSYLRQIDLNQDN